VSESRFRALVASGSYAAYRMSADWTRMRALDGRGFLADTLSENAEWLGTYVHPEDQPVLRAIEAALASRSLFEPEHRVVRAHGSLGWILSRAVPICANDGQLAEWRASHRGGSLAQHLVKPIDVDVLSRRTVSRQADIAPDGARRKCTGVHNGRPRVCEQCRLLRLRGGRRRLLVMMLLAFLVIRGPRLVVGVLCGRE
jgi:hypothetical protein